MKLVEVAQRAPAHGLDECVAAVIGSSTACRRVLDALTETAARGQLTSDPRWDPTMRALARLLDVLNPPRRRY